MKSWAVSTVASVESAAFLTEETDGFLQSLSFQQLLSCDEKNAGCNGGSIITAMDYAWRNQDFGESGLVGGVATLNEYPYTDSGGDTTESCLATDVNATIFLKQPRTVVSVDDNLSFTERKDLMKKAVSYQPG